MPDSVSNPIADSRYWTLLSDVLTRPPVASARPIKAWLLPLLNRFQLDVIVAELLAFQSSQVLAPARYALTILWPLAEKKIGADALGECLGAVFNACIHWGSVDDNLAWICSAVVDAYRNALANAGNKKKVGLYWSLATGSPISGLTYSLVTVQLYGSFLSVYLASWLSVICAASSLVSPSPTKQLEDSIYAAGIDTIFSLDALKQPLDVLFDALSVQSPTSSLFSLLPRLFTSFLNATHRHRSALFAPTTSTTSGKEEVRKMGMEFVKRCWILIQGPASLQEDFDVEKWRSIIGVLGTVEKERLFVPRGMRIDTTNSEYGGELTLNQARDKAVEILEDATLPKGKLLPKAVFVLNLNMGTEHGIEQAAVSIQLLNVLVRIEYDLIGSILNRVLSALINARSL